jgi:hypothetical protein
MQIYIPLSLLLMKPPKPLSQKLHLVPVEEQAHDDLYVLQGTGITPIHYNHTTHCNPTWCLPGLVAKQEDVYTHAKTLRL